MNKVNQFKWFLIGILTISSLVFCVGCEVETEVVPTPTTTSRVTYEVVPIIPTPSLEPSKTPEPTKTEQPSKQLSEQEKKSIIADFVRTNNHCVLPCFMGVELNRSTLDDVKALFSPSMGSGLITKYQSTNETVYSSGFETKNLIRGEFKTHFAQGKTNGITLYLGGLWRPEVSMEDWDPYTIKGVFSQLGTPSQVQFYITEPPNETSIKGIIINYILYYEQINTLIIYFGERTDDTPKLRFCPMQQKPEYLNMHIGYYAKDDSIVGVSLDEVSSYSIDEFYNLDWSNPDSCINLDTNVLKSHKN